MVVASPLRRTIYTALLGFETDIKSKGLKIVALPEIQETSDVACDTGSDVAVLKKEVDEKGLPVDLGLVVEGWNSKVGSCPLVLGITGSGKLFAMSLVEE
jgi:hypothetical protein